MTRTRTISRETHKPRKPVPRQVAVAMELAEEFKRHQLHLAERDRPASLAEFDLADLSPVPLALLSRRGVIVSAGKPLFDLLDAAPDDVVFHSIPEFLRKQDVGAFFKFFNDCRSKGRTQRAEFLMNARERFPKRVLLIVSPLPGANADRMLFRAAFVELTENEQRTSDPRIPQQDTRLMEVIDGIVWEADYPMRFTFVSRQAERILGFPARNWIEDPDFWAKHIYHEDRDRVLQARAQAVKKLNSHVLHYRMLTAARKVIHVKDSAVIVAGAPGWTKISGIITDVTDVEQAREQLRHSNESLEASVAERTSKMQQSLDSMETLCYGIAHDFKAPIRALEGFTGLLIAEHEKDFDDQAKGYVARCKIAIRRMTELIDAVLTYGRLNHTLPELIPIDVSSVVNRVLQSLEPEISQTRARINVQMTFPRIVGNPYLMEQVLTNLIANALKFTRPGAPPEISISATQTDAQVGRGVPAEPLVPAEPSTPSSFIIHNSSFIRITVTDHGIGIPHESTKRMFGMFQKLHPVAQYPGTGIGLSIVKRAVELMNGRVGVFSDPGHGSSFWIELPFASEK